MKEFENYFGDKEQEIINEELREKRVRPSVGHSYIMIRKKLPKRLANMLGITRDCAIYMSMNNHILFISENQQVKTRNISLTTKIIHAP